MPWGEFPPRRTVSMLEHVQWCLERSAAIRAVFRLALMRSRCPPLGGRGVRRGRHGDQWVRDDPRGPTTDCRRRRLAIYGVPERTGCIAHVHLVLAAAVVCLAANSQGEL